MWEINMGIARLAKSQSRSLSFPITFKSLQGPIPDRNVDTDSEEEGDEGGGDNPPPRSYADYTGSIEINGADRVVILKERIDDGVASEYNYSIDDFHIVGFPNAGARQQHPYIYVEINEQYEARGGHHTLEITFRNIFDIDTFIAPGIHFNIPGYIPYYIFDR